MDLEILNLTSIFSFFIFILMAYKIVRKKYVSTPKLPPGPMKLPIIGNLYNLIGSPPHHKLRDLSKKYGPLMHLKLGEISTMVVSSPEFAREVMKTHDLNFASRPLVLATKIMSYDSKDISFSPYGDHWRQLKKIATIELLSSKRVQSFQPIRKEELTKFIKRIASKEGSPINLTEEVLSLIYSVTSRAAHGRRGKGHEELIEVVKEATDVASGFELGDLYPSAKWLQYVSGLKSKVEKLHNKADKVMQNIINAHKEDKSTSDIEDLLDVLLKEDIGLSDESIKAVTWNVYGGGSDTSSTTIIWAMAEMIKNPRVMKKVQAEVREAFAKEGKPNENCIENLKYLKSVVKETLRLHPPSPLLLPRQCAQDCEIKGYHIPMKSNVIINAWAIGRDPNYWNDAEKFYPERFMENFIDFRSNDFEFIPFGAGRRMCPGLTFGLIVVEFALALLMYHFDWKLLNGMKNEDLDMTELFGITVRRKDDLYLIPIAFHP